MAVTKVSISTTDVCLGVYNVLKSIGLVTNTIGTPSTIEAVFSTPLIPDGYYLRLRWYNYNGNRPISIEIGTVSANVFSLLNSIAVYFTTNGDYRNSIYLIYDISAPWIMIYDNGCSPRCSYIGKLDTGKKISFCVTNRGDMLTPPMDLDNMASLGGLWTFHRNCSYVGYYLEQPLAIIDTGGQIMMNGTSPANVIGIKTVSIIFSATTPFTEIGGSILFGGTYIEGSGLHQQLSTYLKIDM